MADSIFNPKDPNAPPTATAPVEDPQFTLPTYAAPPIIPEFKTPKTAFALPTAAPQGRPSRQQQGPTAFAQAVQEALRRGVVAQARPAQPMVDPRRLILDQLRAALNTPR